MSKQQPPQVNPNIDIKNTTAITSLDGNQVFSEGVILRKVSKFITGTSEDGVIPIPVFYDVITGKVLVELLPKELRDEFTAYNDEAEHHMD
jgi:hypothetical protein